MVSTNDQSEPRIPPQYNSEVLKYLPTIGYFYLTFNSISTIYQACTHGDFSMAAFVVFVYFGYFFLMYCIAQLQALPPKEKSPGKILLKSVIWVLTTAILFGFAYQFSTFIHPVAAVIIYVMAISVSSFLFCLYFFYDDHHQQQEKQSASPCYILRINIFQNSSSSGKVISDSKMRENCARTRKCLNSSKWSSEQKIL
ncbi:hypothetical protein DITRI_Ditri09bG0039800 [Diplodiscus trichospermus]